VSVPSFKAALVQGFKTWALPRLVELPHAQWAEAIREAQSVDFDGIERIALIVGVVAVAYLLRIEAGAVPMASLPAVYIVQFIEAAILLVLLVGPFYLRRARRGLDSFIADQQKKRDSQV